MLVKLHSRENGLLHRLRCELEQTIKNGQEMRAAGMQREIMTLRSELERQGGSLGWKTPIGSRG